ncbi:short-chain dehydrogenase reductase family [Paraphaeosphaeria minitans]|uniref:Short-chain dehydrogenase reductase family n=1 Tax=Paraphaeosphaeria minitans TaxID=565426 RepID=A0A9P6KL78_9PLEO|nr:short-chain dehydrogenase reductase family [Paraphaeosphaeria minitans]
MFKGSRARGSGAGKFDKFDCTQSLTSGTFLQNHFTVSKTKWAHSRIHHRRQSRPHHRRLFPEAIASYNPTPFILPGRNASKTRATATKLASLNLAIKTRGLHLDVESQTGVCRGAAKVNAYAEDHIDVLFNNAGVMAGPLNMLGANFGR